MSAPVVRRLLLVLAIVLAALGALAIRVVVAGRAALADGEELLARGQPVAAIGRLEASARWYLPLAPHVDEAYARLRSLAGSEDPAVAIAAWRAIRSAARATGGLWTPHASDLAAADEAIAKLSARDLQATPTGPTTSAREAWHASRLARDGRPRAWAAALAALGVVLWLGGFAIGIRRGIDATGVLLRRPATMAGVTIVVGLVLWVVGLYNA